MRSLAIGSVAAAVVMFALGFVFFGLLGMQAFTPIDTDAASAVQAALGSSLKATGAYMIPPDEQAWMIGPSALVNFVAAGGAPTMPVAMIEGFLHMLITAVLIGLMLRAVGGDFARQSRVVLWAALAASLFMHLGDPIWYGFAWRSSLFVFVCDAIMFAAGGLVLARWFTSTARVEVPTGAAAPAE